MKKLNLLIIVVFIFSFILGCNQSEDILFESEEDNYFSLNQEGLDYLNISTIDYFDALSTPDYRQKLKDLINHDNKLSIQSRLTSSSSTEVLSSIERFHQIDFKTGERGYLLEITKNEFLVKKTKFR